MENKKQFYITTSIAYVNAPPHIGYAMELLEADVIARFHRLRGEEVFFLTGTDEHGKKIAEAAAKAGMDPQIFTDSVSARFKELCAKLDISYSNFIRTTDAGHRAFVEGVWKHMEAQGDIYKAQYEGRYCTGCEAFLREAEIDEEGKCRIHKKEVQAVQEENHFFKFSKYAKDVEEAIRTDAIRIFPEFRKKEILNFFSDEGIKDFSVSRPKESVGWGIPVPGDDNQIIYVWIDALMNYLSGIAQEKNGMTDIWPADMHVIGKDIMRFHTMMLPAFLKALGHDLPKSIAIHGFILSEGQKMSKSLGNVIDPFAVINEYGVEPVRYYLLREIPSDDDGDFSIARFRERYAADLQNGLGNLVSRVATLGEVNPGAAEGITVSGGVIRASDVYKEYTAAIDAFQLHRALERTWAVVEQSNKMVEDAKLWELAKQDPKKANGVFAALAQNLAAIAYMCAPFIPETAKNVAVAIGTDVAVLSDDTDIAVHFQKPSQPLFPRLES